MIIWYKLSVSNCARSRGIDHCNKKTWDIVDIIIKIQEIDHKSKALLEHNFDMAAGCEKNNIHNTCIHKRQQVQNLYKTRQQKSSQKVITIFINKL